MKIASKMNNSLLGQKMNQSCQTEEKSFSPKIHPKTNDFENQA